MALIKCKSCGADISDRATRCPQCGEPQTLNTTCPDCGTSYAETLSSCPNCGAPNRTRKVAHGEDPFVDGPSGKSRGIAAILAIILGGLGVQYFYIGKITAGVICVLVSVASCGSLAVIPSVLGIVQGIILFTKDNEYFESNFVNSEATFPFM